MRQSALLLERSIRQSPIVVMGNSSSLNELDLKRLEDFFVIGCNRGLRARDIVPDLLFISDRQPYKQEKDNGRLTRSVRAGVKVLLSDTIFDSKVRCRRLDTSSELELPAQEEPIFDWYSWRVGLSNVPINLDTFGRELCSFANVGGQILQAAAIFGAKVIGCIGIDLKWPDDGPSHFFGDGNAVGAYPCAMLNQTLVCFKKLKELAEFRGIKIVNLSPWKGTPFAKVFGNYSYDKWVSSVGIVDPAPSPLIVYPDLAVPVKEQGPLTSRVRRTLRKGRRRR